MQAPLLQPHCVQSVSRTLRYWGQKSTTTLVGQSKVNKGRKAETRTEESEDMMERISGSSQNQASWFTWKRIQEETKSNKQNRVPPKVATWKETFNGVFAKSPYGFSNSSWAEQERLWDIWSVGHEMEQGKRLCAYIQNQELVWLESTVLWRLPQMVWKKIVVSELYCSWWSPYL